MDTDGFGCQTSVVDKASRRVGLTGRFKNNLTSRILRPTSHESEEKPLFINFYSFFSSPISLGPPEVKVIPDVPPNTKSLFRVPRTKIECPAPSHPPGSVQQNPSDKLSYSTFWNKMLNRYPRSMHTHTHTDDIYLG